MKILYIDAIKAQHAQSNVRGLKTAFEQVGVVKTFDQRTFAKISSEKEMQ